MKWPNISYVGFAVVFLPLLSIIAPFTPFLWQRMMLVVVLEAVVFGFFALLKRAWPDVFLAALIGLGFFGSWFLFPGIDQETLAIRTSAFMAFAMLSLT